MTAQREYLPAAGRDWLLPLYDPLTAVLGMNSARTRLLHQAELQTARSVLDVGCGTGTLAVQIKRAHPSIEVVGVDPDPRALARARRKAARARVPVRFDEGFADTLGHPAARFDRVFSSMMFHHLSKDDQPRMLREIRRVLRPGGRLEFMDFAGPEAAAHGRLSRLLHSHHRLAGNSLERITALMSAAGFSRARVTRVQRRVFGRLAFFEAVA